VPAQRSGAVGEVGGGATSAGGARRAAGVADGSRARGRGVYLLVTIMTMVAASVLSVTAGRNYPGLTSTSEYFHRHAYTPSYDPISNVERGLPPNTIDAATSRPEAAIRAISIGATQVNLFAGGQVRHSFPTPTPVTRLPDLASLINDPGWLTVDGQGNALLHAALVVVGGATFTIAAPVTSVVLESRRGVLLGAERGTLNIAGVSVRPSAPDPDPERRAVDQRQPFVVAASTSSLNISHSHLTNLGRDWNSSYGVSWTDGSAGGITDSEVDHTFIATYTDAAHDVTIAGNWLHDNTLYGVDPHSNSSRIVVRRNLSERNGRHGIIFSDHVVDSVIEGNIARDNFLNGIMMDAASTGNRIIGNSVIGNRGDGLVLSTSPDNVLTKNTVTNNRVGVMVRGEGGSAGLALTDNVIRGNQVAAQGVSLRGNRVGGNGNHWRPRVLAVIWASAAAAVLLLIVLTGTLRRRRGRHGRHSDLRAPLSGGA
jgi:poly(beta-D-mannuronate) C5 epimerase